MSEEYTGKKLFIIAILTLAIGEVLSRVLGGLIGQALGTATFIVGISFLIISIIRGIRNIIRSSKIAIVNEKTIFDADAVGVIEKNVNQNQIAYKPEGSSVKNNFNVKSIQISIISAAAILTGAGLFYSFGYLPFKKNYDFNQCLKNTESTFKQKHQEISSHISSLEAEKVLVQQRVDSEIAEFLKDNPEPKEFTMNCADSRRVAFLITGRCTSPDHDSWRWQRDSYYANVQSVDSRIRSISSDFDKIEDERKKSEEGCYKRYK